MRVDIRCIAPLFLVVLLGCSQSETEALQEYCTSRDTLPVEDRNTMLGLIMWRHERMTNEEVRLQIREALDEPDGQRRIRNIQALLDAHGVESCAEILHMQAQQAREDALPPHDDSYVNEAFREDR